MPGLPTQHNRQRNIATMLSMPRYAMPMPPPRAIPLPLHAQSGLRSKKRNPGPDPDINTMATVSLPKHDKPSDSNEPRASDEPSISTENGVPKKSLLRLPAELRNNVYELLLTSEVPIELVIVAGDEGEPTVAMRNPRHVGITTSLLHVNKRLHHEALPILYSSNVFLATHTPLIIALFLRTIAPRARSSLRAISIGSLYPLAHFTKLGNSLALATNLKRLEIMIQKLNYVFPDVVAKDLMPWVQGRMLKEGGWQVLEVLRFVRRDAKGVIRGEEDELVREYMGDVRREVRRMVEREEEDWVDVEEEEEEG